MDAKLLSIMEVGELTGLPSSALRYYERAGLIRPKERRSGRRHYTPDVLQRLAVVALLQEAGFTIKEVAAILRRGRKDRWRPLAEDKLAEIDRHIERVHETRELLVSALACRCETLDACELVSARRGRHGRVVEAAALGFRPSEGEAQHPAQPRRS